jgi:murein L,D-transpeptidase YafK
MKKLLWVLLCGLGSGGIWMLAKEVGGTNLPVSDILVKVRASVRPTLDAEAKSKALTVGSPVFIRIFKESLELEVWLQQPKAKQWVLFKTYPIHKWGGGTLGPKLAEGDGQAPEGFYTVGAKQMNPFSTYHLAFNIGYPNAFDQAKGRTGSAIMVHGAKVSIGCFAMTDPLIEEIYLLTESALLAGQGKFPVHIFPFRMTPERMAAAKDEPNLPFWENLQEGHRIFEETKQVPKVTADAKGYHFSK